MDNGTKTMEDAVMQQADRDGGLVGGRGGVELDADIFWGSNLVSRIVPLRVLRDLESAGRICVVGDNTTVEGRGAVTPNRFNKGKMVRTIRWAVSK